MELSVLIEIPKGSRNKYEYDKKRKMVRFDRMIYSAMQYPSDYGFIEDTLGDDGDALDALVLVWEPTFPGCLVLVKPIGVLHMSDDKGRDEKILCVPLLDPNWNHLNDINEVSPHLLKEIAHFFSVYKDLEQRAVNVKGWGDRDAALVVIEEARERLKNSGGKA